jgi:hypothetical protein
VSDCGGLLPRTSVSGDHNVGFPIGGAGTFARSKNVTEEAFFNNNRLFTSSYSLQASSVSALWHCHLPPMFYTLAYVVALGKAIMR